MELDGTSLIIKAFGYEFSPPSLRVDMMREGIHIIRGMMKGEKFTFTGKYYRVDQFVNNPLPSKKVPIMVGGWGQEDASGSSGTRRRMEYWRRANIRTIQG